MTEPTLTAPTVFEWVRTIGPILVALFAAYITYKIQSKQVATAESVRDISRTQSEIADRKLKLELFQKRFEVLSDISAAIHYVRQKGGVAGPDFAQIVLARNRYFESIAPARYLFDEASWGYLNEKVLDLVNEYLGWNEDEDYQPPWHQESMENPHAEAEYLHGLEEQLEAIQLHELHDVLGADLKL